MISRPEFKNASSRRRWRNDVRLELDRVAENFRVGLERDQRAGVFCFADDVEFLGRLAALKFHVIHFAVARDLDLEPFANAFTHFAPTPCVPPENL